MDYGNEWVGLSSRLCTVIGSSDESEKLKPI
jgi:hypothetical protein